MSAFVSASNSEMRGYERADFEDAWARYRVREEGRPANRQAPCAVHRNGVTASRLCFTRRLRYALL